MTSIRRRAFWLTLVVVLGLAAPPLAADESSDRLDDIRRQLAEVDSQIRASRSEASEVGRQVAAAQEVLDQAVANYRAATHRVDETVAEVNQTETRVAVLEGDLELLEEALARTELELAATEDRMEEQAVLLYMQASAVPSLDFFIQSSLADAAAAFAYAGDVFNRDDSVFASYQILEREETRQREALVARKAEAEAELARLEELQDRLETEQEEADRVRAEAEEQAAAAAALLSNIHAAIAAAEEHKDGLEADARALEEEIARRQDPGGERPGLLAWPINGRVVSPFGYRVHPILGIRRLHTGIDIDASTGDPIRAAEAGRVILAQTYGGYGRAVVIDHGGGMATLYAHQSSLAVSQGDQVERGEVIGYVGCTGLCTGPHLHFEVRINGGFVDPMDYLP